MPKASDNKKDLIMYPKSSDVSMNISLAIIREININIPAPTPKTRGHFFGPSLFRFIASNNRIPSTDPTVSKMKVNKSFFVIESSFSQGN
jgi:hypothetical protein